MHTSIAFVTLCTLAMIAAPGHAESRNSAAGLTVYSAQGIDTNLPDLAGRVVHRNLDFDDTYFTGASYTFGTDTPQFLERLFGYIRVHDIATGVEVIGVKHRGIQDHFESTVAYRLNSPYLNMGVVKTRLGYSLGVSYAFEEPMYERAPDDSHDRLMTYMSYELELKLRDYERLSFVTRVHHRSGAYGLFAPRGSGSNFLALGLRLHW